MEKSLVNHFKTALELAAKADPANTSVQIFQRLMQGQYQNEYGMIRDGQLLSDVSYDTESEACTALEIFNALENGDAGRAFELGLEEPIALDGQITFTAELSFELSFTSNDELPETKEAMFFSFDDFGDADIEEAVSQIVSSLSQPIERGEFTKALTVESEIDDDDDTQVVSIVMSGYKFMITDAIKRLLNENILPPGCVESAQELTQ